MVIKLNKNNNFLYSLYYDYVDIHIFILLCTYFFRNIFFLILDPFADAIKGADDDVQDGLVHIRIQQRNGRKTLTTVQGLSSEYDLKKIVRSCKKEFACNGTVIEHPEYGEVLQLQGDQRENICQWLTKAGLAKPDQLKVHGF
uniref:Eukaryotic translation initiation factor eIF1 n=1 Tax=Bactrocera latifrons TaxID=174628 RepID=A0A0K8W6E3_BACLA